MKNYTYCPSILFPEKFNERRKKVCKTWRELIERGLQSYEIEFDVKEERVDNAEKA